MVEMRNAVAGWPPQKRPFNMQNSRERSVLVFKYQFMLQFQAASGELDFSHEGAAAAVDPVQLQSDTDVGGMLITVDGTKMQVFNGCDIASFDPNIPEDAASGANRCEF